MSAELEHISIGCNRTTEVLSWNQKNLIAFGGGNSVFIYKPEIENSAGKIINILNGHKSHINCVKWIENKKSEDLELVSGSSDKNVFIWKYFKNENKWILQQRLEGHTEDVCALATLHYSSDGNDITIVASAASDSTLKIWIRMDKEFENVQTLSFNGFVHCVSLGHIINCNVVMMACGCDDSSVKLYTLLQNHQFRNVLSLTGHEDWVRCLQFTSEKESELLLASSSQDTYIRLWKISSKQQENDEDDDDAMLALEQQMFMCENKKLTLVLESVLIGHEGWIYGVSWDESNQGQSPQLLSASMDRTMIIWSYDEENKVWIDKARMGGVGGNMLGYYGCAFSPSGKSVIGHGYQGAFHLWRNDNSEGDDHWLSCDTISGHYGEVEDFDWDPYGGEFVMTLSTDQTTRLLAPWRRDNMETTWHEIARPQVHGHNMKCLAMLNRYKFASGAQEKVVRMFAAPKSFYDTFSIISNIKEDNESKIISSLPLGATVPVLGLSNKAVFEDDIKSWDAEGKSSQNMSMKASAFSMEDPAPYNPALINEPPVEDILLQNTLWPELQKLYGHGFEIFCMASSPDGNLLATACKASKPEYANIILWDTNTFKQVDSLASHTLTVTQLSFSHNGKYLLSVSRDRTWSLFQQDPTNPYKYPLLTKTDKKTCLHSRIIWSCAWFPDDEYFVTASRDKKLFVWGVNNEEWRAQGDNLELKESITAVSVAKKMAQANSYVVGIGLESGGIHIYTWTNNPATWKQVIIVDQSISPVLTVKRIRWRNNEKTKWQLGVCSSDHSFRILTFQENLFHS